MKGRFLQNQTPFSFDDDIQSIAILQEPVIDSDMPSMIHTPLLESVGKEVDDFDFSKEQNFAELVINDQQVLMGFTPSVDLEMAREEERTKIARELHDQLGHALTAMKFDLAWLSNQLVPKDNFLAQKAKSINMQMDTMIKTVRRIATELRPGMLDDLGLAASIEWQAHDFEKRTGIMCMVSVPSDDLPAARDQSLALFRIFQEALTNVARHASARLIEVKLSATPEALMLEIHDDGQGIQSQQITGCNSLGLLGMRERARYLGGTFDIQGMPDEGTIIVCRLPLNKNVDARSARKNI